MVDDTQKNEELLFTNKRRDSYTFMVHTQAFVSLVHIFF